MNNKTPHFFENLLMKDMMIRHRSFLLYCAAPLLAAACLTLPMKAQAAKQQIELSGVAQRHAACLRPSFTTGAAVSSQDTGGYGIEVQGERFWVALEQRVTFPLSSRDGADVFAQVKLDRPPGAEFKEQARWRVRWLEDVAARAGVEVERQTLPNDVQLLTVNKKVLTGKFAGLSLLVDTPRQSFAQWDWSTLARYAGPQDVLATQAAVWTQLMPCLAKNA